MTHAFVDKLLNVYFVAIGQQGRMSAIIVVLNEYTHL